jgi:hypothetical protein
MNNTISKAVLGQIAAMAAAMGIRESNEDLAKMDPEQRKQAVERAMHTPKAQNAFQAMLSRFVRRQRSATRYTAHQGKQEIARRKAQIERFQLTASNGLVCEHPQPIEGALREAA